MTRAARYDPGGPAVGSPQVPLLKAEGASMRSKAGNVLLFLTLFATACGEDPDADDVVELDASMLPSDTSDGGKTDGGASDASVSGDATVQQDAAVASDA